MHHRPRDRFFVLSLADMSTKPHHVIPPKAGVMQLLDPERRERPPAGVQMTSTAIPRARSLAFIKDLVRLRGMSSGRFFSLQIAVFTRGPELSATLDSAARAQKSSHSEI
jgi:hypothetical protein